MINAISFHGFSKKDEYITNFIGAKLKRREENQAGFSILSGIVGILIAILIFGSDKKLYNVILSCIFAGFGLYIW